MKTWRVIEEDQFVIKNNINDWENRIVKVENTVVLMCLEGCLNMEINFRSYQLQPDS